MKSWPAALFASAVVLAAAIVFASFNTAQSQARGAGFMMASGAPSHAWRVNTSTGAVSYCIRKSDSPDPKYMASNPPICSAWTDPVQ
ncbi:MAG: hypothetical protein KGQ41_04830 [Alphaproteobacteria bacterium]|nr:hypothetical protein [Alphaproteobacteria bacterium]